MTWDVIGPPLAQDSLLLAAGDAGQLVLVLDTSELLIT